MTENDVLQPILEQIEYWIYYDEHVPDCRNTKKYLKFKKENEMECVLTEGNLSSDVVFSLWRPLIITLNHYKGMSLLSKKIPTVKEIKNSLSDYLPPNELIVRKLSELFLLGKTRANMMILPDYHINKERGKSPYNDYMPYFLYECFDGVFKKYFVSNKALLDWIESEHFDIFFNSSDFSKTNLRDLIGSGDIKKTIVHPDNIITMLESYISVLKYRGQYYPENQLK